MATKRKSEEPSTPTMDTQVDAAKNESIEAKPAEGESAEVKSVQTTVGTKRYKNDTLGKRLDIPSYADAIVYCKRQEKCVCEFDAIFYHVNCPDGVTALWAVLYNQLFRLCGLINWKDLTTPFADGEGNGCKGHILCPVPAGKHPLVDSKAFYYDKRVILVDVAFKRSYLEAVSRYQGKTGSILILDHHKSAMRDLTGSDLPSSIVVEFDMERAGCQIAWDRFCLDRSSPRPKLLEYVADRDLWKWDLLQSREVSYYLYEHFFSRGLSKMDKLHDLITHCNDEGISAIVKEVAPAYQVWRSQINRAASNATLRRLRMPKTGKYYKVKLFQSDISIGSEVGNELSMAGDCDFAINWYYKLESNSFGFSCRSDARRTDIDLSEICAEFGGGGHAQAAGFSIPNISIPVRVPEGAGIRSAISALAPRDQEALNDACPVYSLLPDWERCEKADRLRKALSDGSSVCIKTVVPVPASDSYLVSVPRDPDFQGLSLSPAKEDFKEQSASSPFVDGWVTRLKKIIDQFPDYGLHHTADGFRVPDTNSDTHEPVVGVDGK